MKPDDLIARCGELKKNWQVRNTKIGKWYTFLTLKDELAQEGMESVTSNDPRTGYNLGRHLMVSASQAHKIEQDGLTAEQIDAASQVEKFTTKRWANHESYYRNIGKQGFRWQVVSWLLASGWYAVISVVEDERIWSECWSPVEVFPEYDEYGLCEVAHIYSVSPKAFMRKLNLMGWTAPKPKGNTTIYDYHAFDDDGNVANAVAIQGRWLKPPLVDANLTKIHRLPVFMSPVGGLPDMGSVFIGTEAGKWQEHFGESVVATNEEIGKNYNRMLTYTQQLVRDTANPAWLELTNSDNGILKAADLFKRGAIFSGAPGESATPLGRPPIPVELRQAIMDYQNMMQRGSFPWTVFGNVQQQISYLAMASIASSSLSTLGPYVSAYKGMQSDISNYWFEMMKNTNMRPYNFKMPKNLPEEFSIESQLDIEIPGYLVQRATVSRMLNPEFKLPQSVIFGRMFPEVTNPVKAMAETRKETALNHPKVIIADTVLAVQEQARVMRENGDVEGASLYEELAKSLKTEIMQPQQAQTQPAQVNIPREVIPQRELVPPEETGMEGR